MKDPQTLTFVTSPAVTIATNTFIDVPVILEYDDEPLIEMFQQIDASYTTRFRIFNASGDSLAAVEGTQIHLTEAGKKSKLTLRHLDRSTVCELDGTTLFEIERTAAAAVRASAELYAPDGRFIVAKAESPISMLDDGTSLKLGGVVMSGNTFRGVRVGISVRSDASIALGGS